MRRSICLGILCAAAAASADPITLKIATVAPRGTAWAHDFDVFRREIDKGTGGAVDIKFYLNGAAGSELETLDRMEKGQLDGVISGGPLCAKVMPSSRVMYIVGLFQTQGEVTYVWSQLKPTLEKEANASGYHLVASASVGPVVIFSGKPIASMDDLRASKLWTWNLNEPVIQMAGVMGVNLVPQSLEDAGPAYDAGKTDGFTTTPSAALSFQWFAQTRYLTNLNVGFLEGCMVFRQRSLDQLTGEQRAVIDAAGASLSLRIDQDNGHMDDQLLGGAFAHQGTTIVPVSEKFSADFFAAARAAREKLGAKLVAPEVLANVMTWLADYHAEHAGK